MVLQKSGGNGTGFTSNCLTLDPAFCESSVYQHLVENAEAAFFVTDTLSRLVYLNAAGRDLLGFQEGVPEGLRIWDIFAPAESPVVRQIVSEVLDADPDESTGIAHEDGDISLSSFWEFPGKGVKTKVHLFNGRAKGCMIDPNDMPRPSAYNYGKLGSVHPDCQAILDSI